jgi:hypothetical protein
MHIARKIFIRFFVFSLLLWCVGCGHGGKNAVSPIAADDPRNATASIHVFPSDDLRTFLLSFALTKDATIESDLRAILLKWSAYAGFGSGTLIEQNANDHSIIVTNCHVVVGEVPYVSFDEGVTLMRGVILYENIERDLVVLEIPKRPDGFRLASTYVNSQSVIAYGYPFMRFQTTTGSISNPCIHEDDVQHNGSGRCFIQHTAAVNHGSSGGPLVIQDHRLIGINTIDPPDRHSSYLAIPLDEIALAIDEAERGRAMRRNPPELIKNLRAACTRFVNEISSASTERISFTSFNAASLVLFISERLLIKKGKDIFEDEYSYTLKEMNDVPQFGFRVALLNRIKRTIRQNQGVSGTQCDIVESKMTRTPDAETSIHLNSGMYLNLSWAYESGRWVIVNY